MTVRTYNVLVPVVALVQEDSPKNAILALEAQLRAKGFEPHEEGADAFESEDLT